MHLIIDIGNSRGKYAIFQKGKLLYDWSVESLPTIDPSFYEIELRNHLLELDIDADRFTQSTVSSVVPELTDTLRDIIALVTGISPKIVAYGGYPEVTSLTHSPHNLGADLYCNAIAGHALIDRPCVVVDFGTALTMIAVKNAQLLGVSIAPGIGTSLKTLFQETAQLPEVPVQRPKSSLGKTTVDAIVAGVIGGYIGMIRHKLNAIKSEFGEDFFVVGTGGFSKDLVALEDEFDLIDPFFTLRGIDIYGRAQVSHSSRLNSQEVSR